MTERLEAVRALFDRPPGWIYLDAATYGLPPKPTADVLRTAVDGWQAGTADWVEAWDRKGEACRAAFASLIGSRPQTIALVPSASVGVGTVATALRSGDEVVVPDDEFTSLLFPLLVAQRERGVHVRSVPFDRLAESIGPRTRMVAFSVVQSQSGRAAPLAEIVRAARSSGAQMLVDATHAVPFVNIGEHIGSIDFLVCSAYKHLLSPRGVAFLHVAEQHWERVAPWLANWRSAPDPYGVYYGGPLEVAATAARFDVSLAWFCWAAASVSLDLLVRWQRDGVLDEVLSLARGLAGELSLPTPAASVLSVPVDDAQQVNASLSQAGIKGAVRAGSVRLSPHVWNTPQDIEAVARVLKPLVRLEHAHSR